jgi:hypothetical protein
MKWEKFMEKERREQKVPSDWFRGGGVGGVVGAARVFFSGNN